MSLAAGGCAPTTATSAAPVSETHFDSSSGFIVVAEARGRPLRLKVDPGAPWFVLLNGSVAKELRLTGTQSAKMMIGPLELKGKTRTEKLSFNGEVKPRPVMWFNGESVRGADGVINPANLPWDKVTMRLAPPQPNEQAVELPMRFDKERGLYHEYVFAGQPILTRFTLEDSLTTVTGAAASVIANRRGGVWQGSPFMHPVRYGVVRPVRRMVLGEPLSVKGFVLSQLAVRISDDRGNYRLPDQQLPADETQGDIVITGKGRHISGSPHFWLMVGRSDLKRCSSISYDNKSKRLTLRCILADV